MTQYSSPERFCAGATREVAVATGEVRTAVLQAIRSLDFVTTREQFGFIEAERGSKLRGLTMSRARVPSWLHVQMEPTPTGTAIAIRVEDRWGVPATKRGTVAVYADVFTEVLTALDGALAHLDEAAAASFPQWWRVLPEGEIASSRPRAEGVARFEEAMARGTSRLLDGPRSGPTTALADAQARMVTFVAPEGATEFPTETVDGMLLAGQLVASRPGNMPPKLVEDLRNTVLVLEQRVERAGQHGGAPTIELRARDVPVIKFLFQQATLREQLPVRLLMRCTTCRLEKVVNPDLAKLRERNRRVRVLSTSVGAVFGTHSISPFILVGRLSQLKKTEPDFVCLRCQGTDADQQPITFCSKCGERLDGSVLRSCPKCKFDLRTLAKASVQWHELPPPAPVPELVPPSPAYPAQYPSAAAYPPAAYPPPVTYPPPASAPPPVTYPPPVTAPPPVTYPPPGWYADPWEQAATRYWDGGAWTTHVAENA